jgi:hypothetical protein
MSKSRSIAIACATLCVAQPLAAQSPRAARSIARAATAHVLTLSDPEIGAPRGRAPGRVPPLTSTQKMQVMSGSVGGASGSYAWQAQLSAAHPIDGERALFQLHNGLLYPAPNGGEIVLNSATQLVVRVEVETTKPLLVDCGVWNPQPVTWKVQTSKGAAGQTVALGSGPQHLMVVVVPTKTGLFGFGIAVVPPGRVFEGAALQYCEISQFN